MNREQRRSKNNKVEGALQYLDTPCTIKEAVQLARGVAEDVVQDYSQQTKPLQIAVSFQVEIMKSVLLEKGLITDEEFKSRYISMVEEFNKKQSEMSQAEEPEVSNNPTMSASAGDVEIVKMQE